MQWLWLLGLGLASCVSANAQADAAPAHAGSPSATITIPAGVPLRVMLDQRVNLAHPGRRVSAHLAAPLYSGGTLVAPRGATVAGTLVATPPLPRRQRIDAKLGGDFTPLKRAVFVFDQATLPDGTTLHFHTAEATPAGVEIRFAAKRKQSLKDRGKEKVREHLEAADAAWQTPDKWQRVRDFLLGGLPYHSQFVAAGAQFDAELDAPLAVAVTAADSAQSATAEALPPAPIPGMVVKARLEQELNSAHARAGDPMRAILLEPGLDAAQHVVYPEGTVVEGAVTQARAARWFARNGQLRFTFRALEVEAPRVVAAPPLPNAGKDRAPVEREAPRFLTRVPINGHITATEADKTANLKLDQEGGVQSTGGPNKVLAPLALALVAASAAGDDDAGTGQGVVGGNFGLLGRVVVLAARSHSVSLGFATYGAARSLYAHWIARGHDVIFPRDTRVSIELAPVRPTVM